MRLEYAGVYFLLLVYSLHCTYAGDEDDDDSTEEQDAITPCDREVAKILCDDFKEKMSECADKMPDDEKPIFYDCARERVDTDEWIPLLSFVCEKEEEQVETAYDIIKCWNKVMNETVDKRLYSNITIQYLQMENDAVYPEDFFECKDAIFDEALDKASCACQAEKRQFCNDAPPPDTTG